MAFVQRLLRDRGVTRSRSSLPLPATCETFTWLARSYSCLFYERHRDSEDNWPVHERCRERFRVALPVRRGFRDSGSSQQVQQWHLSLAFSKFVEGDLLHQAAPWLVAQDLPHALVVTASNGLSLDQAREHVVNTQLGLGRSVFEKKKKL